MIETAQKKQQPTSKTHNGTDTVLHKIMAKNKTHTRAVARETQRQGTGYENKETRSTKLNKDVYSVVECNFRRDRMIKLNEKRGKKQHNG